MTHWLIVGAAHGLGGALCESLLAAGATVTGITRSAAAGTGPGAARLLAADVRSELEVERAAQSLAADTRFDVLVYNSAIHLEQARADIEQSDPEAILETFDVNAVGAARVLKHFRRFVAPGGLLVFISSEAGSIADCWRPSEYGYCMSKAALNMFSQLVSVREAKLASKVQVVSMHPGWIRTEMGGKDADISAREAAQAIIATLEARRAGSGPPFIDRFGKAMRW